MTLPVMTRIAVGIHEAEQRNDDRGVKACVLNAKRWRLGYRRYDIMVPITDSSDLEEWAAESVPGVFNFVIVNSTSGDVAACHRIREALKAAQLRMSFCVMAIERAEGAALLTTLWKFLRWGTATGSMGKLSPEMIDPSDLQTLLRQATTCNGNVRTQLSDDPLPPLKDQFCRSLIGGRALSIEAAENFGLVTFIAPGLTEAELALCAMLKERADRRRNGMTAQSIGTDSSQIPPVDAETSERIEGPTPAGGAYAIAHFRDRDGKPTTKGKCVSIEVIEYSIDDEQIARTYADVPTRGGNVDS